MDVIFSDDELDRLEVDAEYVANGIPQGITNAYLKRMQFIRAASDERDFYNWRALRFEKLKGKRSHQYSMRLNDQYRLILELLEGNPHGKVVKVVGIEDYH